jgi:hypothetical protein
MDLMFPWYFYSFWLWFQEIKITKHKIHDFPMILQDKVLNINFPTFAQRYYAWIRNRMKYFFKSKSISRRALSKIPKSIFATSWDYHGFQKIEKVQNIIKAILKNQRKVFWIPKCNFRISTFQESSHNRLVEKSKLKVTFSKFMW